MGKMNLQEKMTILTCNLNDLRNADIEDIEEIFSERKVGKSYEEELFLVKKDTISTLVKELLEEKLEADTKIIETESNYNEIKSELLNLRKEIDILEEQLYRMSLAKAVIVPTDELYRTKAEYDALRELNAKLSKDLLEAESKLGILTERNSVLIKKVINLELELEKLKAKADE